MYELRGQGEPERAKRVNCSEVLRRALTTNATQPRPQEASSAGSRLVAPEPVRECEATRNDSAGAEQMAVGVHPRASSSPAPNPNCSSASAAQPSTNSSAPAELESVRLQRRVAGVPVAVMAENPGATAADAWTALTYWLARTRKRRLRDHIRR